jgi:hypothetical protein
MFPSEVDCDSLPMMSAPLAAKPGFANGAQRFASRTPRRLRALLLVIAGSILATIAGPFGTVAIEPAARAGFWFILLLLNFVLWEAWIAWLRRRGMAWLRILLLGFPVMTLPLPLEVDLALRIFAGAEAASYLGILLRGAAITGVMLLVLVVMPTHGGDSADPDREARFPDTAIRLSEIAALAAEDHYVRLHLADGSDRLLHGRFADAVAAMEGLAGEQLGRGAWLADRYRGPAACRNRRWFVRAAGEVWMPVSRSRVADLREKGWLAREG